MAQPLQIEGRTIPAERVSSYFNFMRSISGDSVMLSFPSDGVYHDLVRVYWQEFTDALRDNQELRMIGLPCIEAHGSSNFNFDQFWRDVGTVLNDMPALEAVMFKREDTTDWKSLCCLLGQLKGIKYICLDFEEYEDPNNGTSMPNRWTVEDLALLSETLQGLVGLHTLRIDGYLVPADDHPMDDLFRALQSLSGLQSLEWMGHLNPAPGHLRVSSSFLENATTGLPPALDKLRLKSLGGPSFEQFLAKAIPKASNLTYYEDCLGSYHNPARVLQSLGQSTSIDTVEFELAPRGASTDGNLFQFLTTNTSIVELRIKAMDHISWEDLGQAVGQNRKVHFLSLEGNKLSPSQLTPLLVHLKHNTHLRHLELAAKEVERVGKVARQGLLHAIKDNYSLEGLEVIQIGHPSISIVGAPGPIRFSRNDPWVQGLKTVARLNGYGRGYLQNDPTNKNETLKVLNQCQPHVNSLYFHLRENPNFIG